MSTTPSPDPEPTIERCRPADVTPVILEAADLESTAPEYLRDLKRELADSELVPARLRVEACFDEDCSLATQDEVDRIRGYVRAGSFLGVGSVTVSIDRVENAEKVRPALAACAERAEREGLVFDLAGAVEFER
ncbi:hypothetical protein [Natrarchaeobius oligotrophus]|uniref:DUF7961 domain-containing protein n=1 Tax=Natrarchaeobius chitinivorans TaxID=1679083 RepID=A0A3N6M2H7_NATCH|nr:hypothetical protein [Natrarchaeobius chitinivorans]RQG97608.1 hypothetical protein EA472_18895 [Natrarchaeobius chitinivorans]